MPHFQNNNLPVNINYMTEIEKKQIDALIALNSASWHVVSSMEFKKKIEDMNTYLRTLVNK
jgi:hypothetical protein